MDLTKTQKKNRLLAMIVGSFAIFFTGFPHVWSVYQPYVMEQAGWSQSQASMCFYIAVCTFVFGSILGGKVQNRYSTKITIWVGGGIFAAGILASAFLILPSPYPMYLTYGVMQGIGQGMIYTAILSDAQKWFPEKTGFASGVVVTANGLCGFFLAPLSRNLLAAIDAKNTLLIIGLAIAVSWILCGLFFKSPTNLVKASQTEILKTNSKQKQYTSSEMMHTKNFYLLLATMFFGLMSYFIISPISQTYQIELGISPSIAVSAVMIGSIVNASARLITPIISDKIGKVKCIKAILLVSTLAMLLLTLTTSYAVTFAIIIVYGCFGGIMGNFPSFTSSIFGIEHTGENYGFVMFGVVFATFGAPMVSSLIKQLGYEMNVAFAIGAIFSIASLICLTLLGKRLKKEIIK